VGVKSPSFSGHVPYASCCHEVAILLRAAVGNSPAAPKLLATTASNPMKRTIAAFAVVVVACVSVPASAGFNAFDHSTTGPL
jgi:hypothetical protein